MQEKRDGINFVSVLQDSKEALQIDQSSPLVKTGLNPTVDSSLWS